MKFSVSNEQLKEGLAKLKDVLPKGNTIPILNGIKVTVTENCIQLKASNSDMTMEYSIEVDGEHVTVENTGSVVWNKMMTEVGKKLPGDTVTFELADNLYTTVKAGAAEFNIAGMDPDEYPLTPSTHEKSPVLILEGNCFQEMVNKTAFAASTIDTRPILQAVFVELLKEGMVFTSTDSHRLGRVMQKCENQIEAKYPVPAKALNTAIKTFSSSKEVEVYVEGDSQLLLKSGNVVLAVRLFDGNYPDTTRLIPNEYKTKITINRKELQQAIERMAILESGSIKFDVVDEKVKISINQKESGNKAEEVIMYSDFEGEQEVSLSFSPKYMTDALKTIDTELVCMTLNGAMRPLLVTPKVETVNSSLTELQLILPIRTY